MMKNPMRVFRSILILEFAVLAGCGRPEPEAPRTVAVSGIVTLDGQPLASVAVHFYRDMDHVGVGITGADGRYRLTTGAQPGLNSVYFKAVEKVDGTREGDLPDPGMDQDGRPTALSWKIPQKYSDGSNPAFTFLVTGEGTAEADFALTWD